MDYISLLCCLVAFLLYYNTLDAGFVYDDRRAILSNPDLLPTTPWHRLLQDDFWGTPLSDSGSHGSYRPLCVLSFRLNYLLGGFQPWGYHLVNVLLHCLATVLLVRVSRHILPRSRSSVGSAVTGLIFATHPIHTEAVAGVVGRADLAACNLYLLSFLAYISHIRCRDIPCCSKLNVTEGGLKQFRGLKYHRFVVNLQNNVTNCNWPKRLGREVTQSEAAVSSVQRSADSEDSPCCWRNNTKRWLTLSVSILLSIASMLSKETGITVLGICLLFDFLQSPTINKRQWKSGFVLIGAMMVMLMARLQGPTPQFATADNPTAKDNNLLTRFLTFTYLPVLNVWLMLCPVSLSFDWGMDAVPRISGFGDIRNGCTVAFYGSMLLVIRYCVNGLWKRGHYRELLSGKQKGARDNATAFSSDDKGRLCPCTVCHQSLSELHSASCRSNNNNNSLHSTCICWRLPVRSAQRSPVRSTREVRTFSAILMAIAFLALPFLPATNILFYVGFVVAERVLYLPSAGLCLLIGLGAAQIWSKKSWRLPATICLFLTLLAFSVRTTVRNLDWTSEEALYHSAVPINPPKAYGNLGSVLSSQGRVAEAESAFRKALHFRPNMADVHYNLGVLLQGKQQLSEAIFSFQRAIHFRPSLALAYVNLGAALIAAGRCQEAVSVLREGSRVDGTGLRDRREHDTARVSALLQLGALYSDQGRLQRALATYREAAHSLPDHYPPQSVFNVLGETLARLHQDEEAERWYQAALNAQPDHVPAHITYGKLLAKNVSRIVEAEQWFRRAKRLAPEDASVYHHYGEFLASKGRHKEAANLYEKAAELKPMDYELAVAAATAMRQAGRHGDAEHWYRRAVLLKPSDARGHTNLGAILHLNGKYREAADSYREALRLQPNDVTTLTNLHRLHSVMT
ncbi:PREDICTED: transmembrane and TPR repeat-containing protein CG4341 [Nicrophorus vespilloides]|uniref:dolichyl-phosphate-mannose--protein mannosyltransferase n=1 Tax=Nicrophorus vespilloides TaxID=110193 RepID=A0ABM1M351_NICVS|nr:PREDICTED: transmembrane and TPR repeat-containing protein CG4341 [Nicrophorus vespilloides]XP_017769002.1 PREDICTED: transmembrane and TPR repeat-containing protein CG4341 [Nicrophorus vespilloides]